MNSVGIVVLAVALIGATAFGLWRRRVDGEFKATDGTDNTDNTNGTLTHSSNRMTAEQLGESLGRDATLVEFSSAFCSPCRATRRILDRVVDDIDGVALVEIDAEEHLDLTRQLSVTRTPTVLILDGDGVIRHRAAGQPRYADVIGALGSVIPGIAKSG